jgi:hypothetical protein
MQAIHSADYKRIGVKGALFNGRGKTFTALEPIKPTVHKCSSRFLKVLDHHLGDVIVHKPDLEKKGYPMLLARDILSKSATPSPRRKATPRVVLLKNVKDESGHEHGNDGKFVSTGGTSDAPQKPGKGNGTNQAQPYKKVTLRRETDLPSHIADTSKPHAVFLSGGGGSGKGGVAALLVGGKVPGVGVMPPLDSRFDPSRVTNSDHIKAEIPGYDKDNPSGAMSLDEYHAMPQETRDGIDRWIQEQSGGRLKSAEDFRAAHIKPDFKSQEGHFGGGLVHELSSHYAKERLAHAIAHPEEGSFVYDAVGSRKHIRAMKEALKSGYQVTLHHVSAPREVAHFRNDQRPRTVETGRLNGTHDKIEDALPALRTFVARARKLGYPIHFHSTNTVDPSELKYAQSLGYTPTGRKKPADTTLPS